MDLMDLREPDGPYWDAYQSYRQREHVIDNPGFVPPWFMAKLAKDRLAAARVALEQVDVLPMDVFQNTGRYRELADVHEALRLLEDFIRGTSVLDPHVEMVVAGLLGAQEVEIEHERREHADKSS